MSQSWHQSGPSPHSFSLCSLPWNSLLCFSQDNSLLPASLSTLPHPQGICCPPGSRWRSRSKDQYYSIPLPHRRSAAIQTVNGRAQGDLCTNRIPLKTNGSVETAVASLSPQHAPRANTQLWGRDWRRQCGGGTVSWEKVVAFLDAVRNKCIRNKAMHKYYYLFEIQTFKQAKIVSVTSKCFWCECELQYFMF